jgi:hypothetical protein
MVSTQSLQRRIPDQVRDHTPVPRVRYTLLPDLRSITFRNSKRGSKLPN